MTNTLTVDQLQELLQIQKDFDSRIPTLNLEDSKIAYIVEFFEWFNTLETFKSWKKKPGKPLDVQLDELADMLAFGLSIANQCGDSIEDIIENVNETEIIEFIETANRNLGHENAFTQFIYDIYHLYDYDFYQKMLLPFAFAYEYYSIEQLIAAYKKKMERNHARQDGTADKDKGYVWERHLSTCKGSIGEMIVIPALFLFSLMFFSLSKTFLERQQIKKSKFSRRVLLYW